MHTKPLITTLAILALPLLTLAQDKIYKTNGDVISTKIKSVNIKTISYVRYDNQNGPEYTIIKNEVEKIVYQNGTTDEFEHRMRPPHRHNARITEGPTASPAIAKPDYGNNVIGFAPLQFSDNGLGISLSYERTLDRNGIITFYVPAILTWNLNNTTTNNSGITANGHEDKMFYVMPGVKIYPTGCNGFVRYAIGPSLALATGERTVSVYDPFGYAGSYYNQTQTRTLLGIVINNSLNINPTPHIYLGLELGLGFTYFNRLNGINQGTTGIAQGSFKIGYRF